MGSQVLKLLLQHETSGCFRHRPLRSCCRRARLWLWRVWRLWRIPWRLWRIWRLQRPLLMPSPDMATTATALTDTAMLLLTPTDIIIMARGLLMPSPAMGITAMGTEATTEDTMATVATQDTTTARGLLMLSPDTGIMVMGTEATMEDTMAMVATEDTTTVEKFQKFMLIQSD